MFLGLIIAITRCEAWKKTTRQHLRIWPVPTLSNVFLSGCSTTKPAWYLSQYHGDQPDTIVVVSLSDNYRHMFGFPHLCKFTAEHYIDSFPWVHKLPSSFSPTCQWSNQWTITERLSIPQIATELEDIWKYGKHSLWSFDYHKW